MTGQFQDLSQVKKFELRPEEYEKRTGLSLVFSVILVWLIQTPMTVQPTLCIRYRKSIQAAA